MPREALKVPGARVHPHGKGADRLGHKKGHITVAESQVTNAALDCLRRPDSQRIKNSIRKAVTANLAYAATWLEQFCSPYRVFTIGCDSDLPVLKLCLALFDDMGIPYQLIITSAHGTPKRMLQSVRDAAHLPRMIASSTALLVIGVPNKSNTLDNGQLVIIVQMPVTPSLTGNTRMTKGKPTEKEGKGTAG